MRKALLTIAIVVTIATAGSALAQAPNIAVYFDANYLEGSADCPSAPIGSVMDTLYVVGHNFNMWLGSVEFAINYPAQIGYLGDIVDSPTSIGNTSIGLSIVWNPPKNGFADVLLCRVNMYWNCDSCDGVPGDGWPLTVIPNPDTGQLRALRWPDLAQTDLIGMLSYVCAQVPVEDSTWGQIKALYH